VQLIRDRWTRWTRWTWTARGVPPGGGPRRAAPGPSASARVPSGRYVRGRAAVVGAGQSAAVQAAAAQRVAGVHQDDHHPDSDQPCVAQRPARDGEPQPGDDQGPAQRHTIRTAAATAVSAALPPRGGEAEVRVDMGLLLACTGQPLGGGEPAIRSAKRRIRASASDVGALCGWPRTDALMRRRASSSPLQAQQLATWAATRARRAPVSCPSAYVPTAPRSHRWRSFSRHSAQSLPGRGALSFVMHRKPARRRTSFHRHSVECSDPSGGFPLGGRDKGAAAGGAGQGVR
jgi:hypothetical protein